MKRKHASAQRSRAIPAFTAALIAAGVLSEARAQIQNAGTLFVNVDATALPEGPVTSIPNTGTLGGVFATTGDDTTRPVVATVGGTKGIQFDGTDFLQLIMSASDPTPILAPFELTGENPTRSIEVWALNPEIATEETLVSWGHRGGAPDGSNMSFNYGSEGRWGAVGHWGNRDLGWNNGGGAPAANRWHHLVYTYDGTSTRVYADGVLMNGEYLGEGAVNTWPDTYILIGAQSEPDGVTVTPGLRFSGTIARVRVHDEVLTSAQVAANYNAEKAAFIDPPQPPPQTPPIIPSEALTKPPVHRYSFNEAAGDATDQEFRDSIGTAHGRVLGFGANFTGSRLVLPGGPSGEAAYGDLPNNLLSMNSTNNGGSGQFSFETWMKVTGGQNWSRVFDFGSTGNAEFTEELFGPGGGGEGRDYFMYSATVGTDTGNRRLELRNEDPAGGGIVTVDNPTPTANQDTHLVVTWNEATGQLIAYENGLQVSSVTTDDAMSDINDVNVWLGRSNWTGDANLQGEYDEVRLYDTVLTPGQVLGNAFTGPNSLSTDPVPVSIVTQPESLNIPETSNARLRVVTVGSAPIQLQWYRNDVAIPGAVYPSLLLTNVSIADNGAVITARITNIVNGTQHTVTTQPATLTVFAPAVTLKHRYSFNETSGEQVMDSVGNAHGTVAGGPAVFENGQLMLDGSGTYVDLPNGILSGLGSDGTIEVWVTNRANAAWTRIFDFGVSDFGENEQGAGVDFFFLSPNQGGDGFPRFEANFPDGGNVVGVNINAVGFPASEQKHVVVTWSASGNTSRVFVDGVLAASSTAPRPLSDLAGQDVNNWLGRSQFIADAYWSGSYDEVRLHSGAMTPSQVQASFAAGPNNLPTPEPSAPAVSVTRSGNNLTISWPASATGFVLESTPALGATATWTAVSGTTTSGDQVQATVPIEGTQRYFRLKRS